MTNQSIKNAFQRFWEHVVSLVDDKANKNDLIQHISDIGNPHGVTAEQVGADPEGSAATALSEAQDYTNQTSANTLELANEYTDNLVSGIPEPAFVVTISGNDIDGYSADKSFIEIQEAHDNNLVVLAEFNGSVNTISFIDVANAIFGGINETMCTITITSDNVVSVYYQTPITIENNYDILTDNKSITGAIDELHTGIKTASANAMIQADWEENDKTSVAYIKNKTHGRNIYYDSGFVAAEEKGIIYNICKIKDAINYTGAMNTYLTRDKMLEVYDNNLYYHSTGIQLEMRMNASSAGSRCVVTEDKITMLDESNYYLTYGTRIIYVILNTTLLNEEDLVKFPEAGVYFIDNFTGTVVSEIRVTLNGYAYLRGSYIPNTIARVDYVDTVLETKADTIATEETIALLAETGFISPATTSSGDIYTNTNGDIYVI